MSRYIRKQSEVDAFLFGVHQIPEWFMLHPDNVGPVLDGGRHKVRVRVSLETEVIVPPFTWIIKGLGNEIYPCTRENFARYYDEVLVLTTQQKVQESNDRITKMARETSPFIYCLANDVSQSITELVSAALRFEKEQHVGKRKYLIEKMGNVLEYELQFINTPKKFLYKKEDNG